MRRFVLLICSFFTFFLPAYAQMWNGTDTLYGNEWIRYDQQYYKIMVAEDGVYRIPYEALESSGLPVGAMFGAMKGDERTLLELAYELEQAAPWSARRPPLFG